MRMVRGIGILTLASSVACASRSGTTSTETAKADTVGAQAAARLTVQDLEARMKNIGSTYPAMRMHLMANMTGEAAREAQQLAVWFGDVERFWAQQNKPDAVTWAQSARTFATEVAGAATAGDTKKATQAAANMQGACTQCHGTYREADPAGGFRIKPGVIAG